MSDIIKDPYKFAPLSGYGFRDRLLIRFAGLAIYALIEALGSLVRMDATGLENYDAIVAAGHFPIFTYWHERVFLGSYFWRNRGIIAITSQSLDGEYTARMSQRLGYGAIRGSSTRGGSRALIAMIHTMRAGYAMAFATDGPKGPPLVAKPGPVMLAKKTGNPILPFTVEAHKYWRAGSWDRLHIPKPFTRAKTFIGSPIYVPADSGETEIAAKLKELQTSLDELYERGRTWRKAL